MVKKAPAGQGQKVDCLRQRLGIDTRRKGGYDYASHALVEAAEEGLLVDSIGGLVKVKSIVVG